MTLMILIFFCQAEAGIRDRDVTGVQTCALPILELLFEGPRARELHLHLFRGALTQRERVLALHEVDDRFVELVAADAARSEERRVGKECSLRCGLER